MSRYENAALSITKKYLADSVEQIVVSGRIASS